MARYIAKIYKELGILSKGHMIETDRATFGNGRGVRNFFEKVKSAQALRLVDSSFDREALLTITGEDIVEAEKLHQAL